MTNHNFYPKITFQTRLSNKHGTLINNFFCTLTETTPDTTSGILINTFANNQPNFTTKQHSTYKRNRTHSLFLPHIYYNMHVKVHL